MTTSQALVTLAMALPMAAAFAAMTRASFRGGVMSLDEDATIYASGLLVAIWAFALMLHTLLTTGPGIVAGLHFSAAALTSFRLAETMREHVPMGWPWGYQGG